jgi:predicted MFS family arabinose efflux permease
VRAQNLNILSLWQAVILNWSIMSECLTESSAPADTRRLTWLIVGEMFNSAFCALTVFGSAFTLFLNELGLDKSRIGFVISLIPFCGILAPVAMSRIARFGFKRTFLLFWALRKVATAFLLLTPAVLGLYGADAAFRWVAGAILFFAAFRAIGETGYFPWSQEMIPNAIRGKFSAINMIIATIGEMGAVAVAGYIIDRSTGLGRFMVLIGAGVVLGFLSVWLFSLGPSCKPSKNSQQRTAQRDEMRHALRDQSFLYALAALALIRLGSSSCSAFTALYAKEQIGLSAGTVMILGLGASAGAMVFSYLWGWTADRYSSKLVMASGAGLLALLPLLWFLLPRHSPWSAPAAMAISTLGGIANMGWVIGWGRYLMVTAIPTAKKEGYIAIYYAWSGLVLGSGPLLAGKLLEQFKGLGGQVYRFAFDQYTPLFALSFVLLAAGIALLSQVREDSTASLRALIRGLFRRERAHAR